MASYSVDQRAVTHARRVIDDHEYVLDSDRGDAQPSADDENTFLETHPWDGYAAEWRHKEVELATYDLLQAVDSKRARASEP